MLTNEQRHLAAHHWPHARSIILKGAKLRAMSHHDTLEALSLAGLELTRLIERYDPTLDIPLDAYISVRIRHVIADVYRYRPAWDRRTQTTRIVPLEDLSTDTHVYEVVDTRPTPPEEYEANEDACQQRQDLTRALQALTDRELYVIRCHYFEGKTDRALGLELSLNSSRISQIRTQAKAKLRAVMGTGWHLP